VDLPPAEQPGHLQFNAFADKDPKGFGLVQTDHEFASYQDTVDWYSRRPSLWVEPTTAWGEGSIDLLEIPTTGETLDNIVAFWTPKNRWRPVIAELRLQALLERPAAGWAHRWRGSTQHVRAWVASPKAGHRASITRKSGPDASRWTSPVAAWTACRKARASNRS
jgi:glucan biosynthesis protein